MASYPTDYRYSEEHEWVRVEGDEVVLGITQYAQDELGEVVYVDLPEVGADFDADDEIGSIESVKAVAEVYTPLAGEVVAVNQAVVDAPELINQDPHQDGWLVRLKPTSTDLSHLLDADGYQALIEGGA